MQGTLYNNPFLAQSLGNMLGSIFPSAQETAAAELGAAQAGMTNDTRRYRAAIGEAGQRGDMNAMALAALQAGSEYSSQAPEIGAFMAGLPGSGFDDNALARLQVSAGVQAAEGTFPGLAQTLANALERDRGAFAHDLDKQNRQWARDDAMLAKADDTLQSGLADIFPQAGGEGISPAASAALTRLEDAVGPLNITSGYRDPAHNAKVGGAKGSQHIHGNAFDVDVSKMPLHQREALIRQAREAGFNGIGVYDNSLHFDVGGDRAWGPSYHRDSLPEWAAAAVGSPVGQFDAGPAQPQTAFDPRLRDVIALAASPYLSGDQSGVVQSLMTAMMPNPAEPYTLTTGQGRFDGQNNLVALGPAPAPEPLSPEGKTAADVRAGFLPADAAKPYDTDGETALRKEWTSLPQVKDFQAQTTAMGRIAAAATDPSAAGDLALIFSFMKILDPQSVVRETEFANAQNAAGVPDQIRNLYNRILRGERLNPEQRADFVGQSTRLYRDAEGQVNSLRGQYEKIAGAQGLDFGRTLPNFGYTGELPTLPAAGVGDTPPPEVDPEIWGVMTPEEKALWQVK